MTEVFRCESYRVWERSGIYYKVMRHGARVSLLIGATLDQTPYFANVWGADIIDLGPLDDYQDILDDHETWIMEAVL